MRSKFTASLKTKHLKENLEITGRTTLFRKKLKVNVKNTTSFKFNPRILKAWRKMNPLTELFR